MQRRCEPLVAHVEPVEEGLAVHGKRGELLKVLALRKDIVHVTHLPEGGVCAPVEKSWVVVGDEGCLERRRDDHETLNGPEDSTVVQTSVSDDGAVELRTDALRVVVGANKLGSDRPFRLQWFTNNTDESADATAAATTTTTAATTGAATSAASAKPFAEDAVLSAYAYELPHGKATHRMERKPDVEYYYGVGEVTGNLNRAGRRFELACRDAMGYDAETSDALYKHFPFYITYNKEAGIAYGILYDQLCGGYLDLGREISAFRGNFRTYASVAGFVDYYLILGPTVAEVVEKLGRLVGRPAVPPAWALGYVASTMTYADAPDAQQRLEAFPALCKRNEMPCDGFYLSSGYTMDADGNRNVFTWNKDRVPDPENMLGAFHQHNMGVIANVKPWLLEAHPEYADMEALGGFFRTNNENDDELHHAYQHHHLDNASDASPYVKGWFWKGGPGTFASGSYLDFTNPVAFNWWKAKLKEQVLAPGVDAVWNDNNEYEVDDDGAVCYLNDAPIASLGRTLQPFLMARASYEALCETRPEKRPLVVSRSGCLGIAKYAAQTWSGDNSTSFHTLKWNIPMSLGLSLCGWVGCGPDIGGFVGNAVTPELFVRWIQLGIYMARFSIHSSSWKASAASTANATSNADDTAAETEVANVDGYNLDCTNEPWMFPEMTDTVRSLLQLRVRLRPLLLSLHIEAWRTSAPVMRPLAYQYVTDANERSRTESFEFTLGPNLLVAAVLDADQTTRSVYFPGDAVGEFWCDLDSGIWYSAGTEAHVHAPLQGRAFGAPVFLRNGGGLVLADFEDARVRNVILAAHPAQASQDIVVEWYEDPTPGQEGAMRNASDVAHICVRATATANEVIINSIERTGPPAPVDEIRFELVPSDHRQLIQASD
ncbi:Alpha-glucosidase [Hondaea fermentalgiana]|uniref:Alpha-glucosidase n=1 Tax=Hondaea fermentalgiana TaxID=2315210 RepID=A0A2R5GR85_9STRA|nr:Alpha-glucosidase [Hondaea fermentalgiana]|eukprot:GBG31143.1 Alpha-glucosidase [Hondaea fermentalgiana]